MTQRDLRVAFLGDSFVAGVGDPTGLGWVGRLVTAAFAAGSPLTAYNLGIRRETSSDIRQRWLTELGPRFPPGVEARVVLSWGVNDTTLENGNQRIPPTRSVENLTTVLQDADARKWPMLMVGPPPVVAADQQERIADLSSSFAAVCARAGVPYLDVFDQLRTGRVWVPEASAGDGAHPGSQGYQQLAELVTPGWLDWLAVP